MWSYLGKPPPSGILFLSVVNSVANHERAKEAVMIDYSEYLEGYRDAQAYDVEEGGLF